MTANLHLKSPLTGAFFITELLYHGDEPRVRTLGVDQCLIFQVFKRGSPDLRAV